MRYNSTADNSTADMADKADNSRADMAEIAQVALWE